MDLKKIVMEEQLDKPEVELDEEDHEDLIYECHDLLSRVLDRANPQWLQAEGLKLLKKLEVTLQWHKIH